MTGAVHERVLCDASVVVKWFHSKDETEVAEARAILSAHVQGAIQARILDLTLYEVGNVTIRSLGWEGRRTASLLGYVVTICGEPLTPTTVSLATAAELAAEHDLSFYDAAYWAAARELRAPLVSADRELLGAGAAESPRQLCQRLELSVG